MGSPRVNKRDRSSSSSPTSTSNQSDVNSTVALSPSREPVNNPSASPSTIASTSSGDQSSTVKSSQGSGIESKESMKEPTIENGDDTKSTSQPRLTSSSSSSPPPIGSTDEVVSPILLHKGSSSPTSSPAHSSTAAAVGAAQHSSSPSSSSSSSASTSSNHGSPSTRRVKLYRLKDDAWEDLGTGTCVVEVVESQPVITYEGESHHANASDDGSWIVVRKESANDAPSEEGELLLKSKVMPYPPGHLSDEDAELELDNDGRDSAEGRVIDAGGYQRQQDTLIVWTERETDQEMALSFATAQGCHEIWEHIKAARKWSLDQPLTSPSPSPSRASSPHSFQIYPLHSNNKLPEPSLGNLAEVEGAIRGMSRTAVGRERTASAIVKSEYIQKLIRIHEEAEDLESLDDLHALCRVMQTILLLNDNVIFELVLRDEIILGVASILEYDPEFPTMKASYRAHLADPSHFTQVVPIRSPALLAKIHQTHRLHYLKDVVLARVLEDSTFSMLNSAIYFNEVDIVNDISGDPHFLRELFALFDEESDAMAGDAGSKGDKGKGKALEATKTMGPQLPSSSPDSSKPGAVSPSRDRQLDAILFLQQFALMAKNLQLTLRAQFFRSLADRGLLRVLEVALARSTHAEIAAPQLRSATIAILMTLVDHDPNNVRSYSLKQQEAGKRPLMGFLIDLFLSEEDLGLKAQMSEALRVLVDAGGEGGPLEAPPRMRQEDPEAEKFLSYFYDHCVQSLLAPILKLPDRPASADTPLELPVARIALCAHLCDLLCFFIAHHTFRSKYFVLSSSVATNVAKLFSTRHKHLRLAALRFFRACVQRNDDFYNRFLIKNDLFRPILDLALQERNRDNLLGSACLEFFEFVKSVNAKAVINHVVERYGDKIKLLATTLKTFENLVIKHEQNNEPPPVTAAASTTTGTVSGSASGASTSGIAAGGVSMARENSSSWATRMEVEEEESYFNGSDDEDSTPAPASGQSTTSRKRQTGDEAEGSPERQKRAKLADSESSKGSGIPLVDYGEDEDEATSAPLSAEVEGEGGFIKEDGPVEAAATAEHTSETSTNPSTTAAPPLLSLAELKKKKEEEEDGELGLLSKKKTTAPVKSGSPGNGATNATGGIKISLGGVKSSLSKLSGGGSPPAKSKGKE